MVSRCEVDLMKIRMEFKTHFGKSLYQTISVRISLNTSLSPRKTWRLTLLFTFLLYLGAHKGWLPESSAESVWRRWLEWKGENMITEYLQLSSENCKHRTFTAFVSSSSIIFILNLNGVSLICIIKQIFYDVISHMQFNH